MFPVIGACEATSLSSDKNFIFVFLTVTENEVRNGIICCKRPEKHCACFVRVLNGVDQAVNDEDISLYVDLDSKGRRDQDSKDRLDCLRFEKVREALRSINVKCFELKWEGKGIDLELNSHEKYLKEFGKSFFDTIKKLIDQHIVEKEELDHSDHEELHKEILHHASFCVSRCSIFTGRDELLEKIRESLLREKSLDVVKPITVYGSSGSGKTSILAMVTLNSKQWLGHSVVTMVRFLGTSPGSSNVFDLLKGLCEQICLVYEFDSPPVDIIEDFNLLCQYFTNLMCKVSDLNSGTLFIVLDSLDQLHPSNNAYTLNWLPKKLPRNVLILVSTLPEEERILENMKLAIPEEQYYVKVSILPQNTASLILDNWFQRVHRIINDPQREKLMNAFEKTPQPLYLKLVFDEACFWKSYTPLEDVILGSDTRQMISLLYDRLERSFGKILVSRALGYITASVSGLSENELEDILSLDDTVLNDVYEYWDPPVEGIIRLPPLLWKRIRYQLEEYLVERQADGAIVLNWYHRQFAEAAFQRYLSDEISQTERCTTLAEFFVGTWSDGKNKPIIMTKRGMTYNIANRQVASQPLTLGEGHYNLRKLSELPHALIKCREFSLLYLHVVFNFEWILTKIKATSINDVLLDYSMTLKAQDDPEVQLLHDSLVLSSSNLQHDVESLANELLGRLNCYAKMGCYVNIESLLRQAREWCMTRDQPTIMPLTTCMVPPGGSLLATLRGHASRVHAVKLTKDKKTVLCVAQDDSHNILYVWNIQTRECRHVYKVLGKSEPGMAVSPDDNSVAFGGDSIGIVKIKLDYFHIICPDRFNTFYVSCIQFSLDGQLIVAGSANGAIVVIQEGTLDVLLQTTISDSKLNCIRPLKKGNVVGCGLNDGTFAVYDITRSEMQCFEKYHQNAVREVMEMQNSAIMVLAGEDGKISFWDSETYELKKIESGHRGSIFCTTKVRNFAVSGGKDCLIKVWEPIEGDCVATLRGHDDAVWCLTRDSTENLLVSGSKDDFLKVWDTENWSCIQTLIGHSSWISCVDISFDGRLILSGSNDKKVKLWQVERAHPETSFSSDVIPNIYDHVFVHATQPTCIAMAPNAQYVLSGSKGDRAKVWDLQSAACIHKFDAFVSAVLISNDSKYAFIGHSDGRMTKVDLVSGRNIKEFEPHKKDITALQVTSDDAIIISASEDGQISLTNLSQTGEHFSLRDHDGGIKCMVLSNDNKKFVSAGKDKIVRVWELNYMRNGDVIEVIDSDNVKCLYSLEGHSDIINSVAISKDDTIVASGSKDGTVRSWKLTTGLLINSFKVTNDSVTVVCPSFDGKSVVSGAHTSKDQLCLWDITMGDIKVNFKGHSHAVMCIKITDDGNYLLSGSRDGTVKLWKLSSGELLDTIDLQSQAKFMSLSKRNGRTYILATTSKTGSILIAKVILPSYDDNESCSSKVNQILNHKGTEAQQVTIKTSYREKRCCRIF